MKCDVNHQRILSSCTLNTGWFSFSGNSKVHDINLKSPLTPNPQRGYYSKCPFHSTIQKHNVERNIFEEKQFNNSDCARGNGRYCRRHRLCRCRLCRKRIMDEIKKLLIGISTSFFLLLLPLPPPLIKAIYSFQFV